MVFYLPQDLVAPVDLFEALLLFFAPDCCAFALLWPAVAFALDWLFALDWVFEVSLDCVLFIAFALDCCPDAAFALDCSEADFALEF